MGSWLDQNSPYRWMRFSIGASSAKRCNQHKEGRNKASQMLKYHKPLYSFSTDIFRSYDILMHNTYSHNRNQRKIQINKQATKENTMCAVYGIGINFHGKYCFKSW